MTIQTIYFFATSVLFFALFSFWNKEDVFNFVIKFTLLGLGFWGAYLGFNS